MSTILQQLKKQKDAELATLENLEVITNNNIDTATVDELFEASLEALDDTNAIADSIIEQIIRVGSKVESNESFSDEVIELEKSIANFNGATSATLEALDELSAESDGDTAVTLLAKSSLYERVKMIISRLYTSFKLAFKKFASKDQVKAMESFKEGMDTKLKDIKVSSVKEAKVKSTVSDISDLDKLGVAYNTVTSTLKGIADEVANETKSVAGKLDTTSNVDLSKFINKDLVDTLNLSLEDTMFEAVELSDMVIGKGFLVAKEDVKVEEVTLKDPASAANIKVIQDVIKVPKPASDLYTAITETTKQAQKLTDAASDQMAKEEGIASASATAKSASNVLKVTASIAKAEKMLGAYVMKEMKVYAKAVKDNAEK